MSRYARRRDDAEPVIIAALRKVGASVQTLDETGAPDLLVGFARQMFLLEVKDAHGQCGKGRRKTESGLRESQETWWSTWKGPPPQIVTNAQEALKAIGAL